MQRADKKSKVGLLQIVLNKFAANSLLTFDEIDGERVYLPTARFRHQLRHVLSHELFQATLALVADYPVDPMAVDYDPPETDEDDIGAMPSLFDEDIAKA